MAEEEAEDQKVRQSARDALDRLSSDDKVNYVIYIVLYVHMCVYARACMCVCVCLHMCACILTYGCICVSYTHQLLSREKYVL